VVPDVIDPGRPTKVAFVLEQHVGHRTYAENLASAVNERTDVDATWIDVAYQDNGRFHRYLPGGLRAALSGRAEVRRGLSGVDRDVTVFNTQVPAALGGRRARRRPYIVITDVTPRQYDRMAVGYGHTPDRGGALAAWKHQQNRRVFQDAFRCVAWSEWAAESIVDEYDVPSESVVVISPGIDTERWSPIPEPDPVERPRILFVGGEFERKGGDLLLAAFDRVADRSELWIVTKSRVTSRPGVHVVDDLGPNDPRLVDLYRSASVFVLPSKAETFGIAAVEASSVGLPIIATRVGGLADIVAHEESGLTVPVGDQASLEAALERLIDDRVLRQRFGEHARARALERFDARRNAEALLGLVSAATVAPLARSRT
jgi:glycosyltransferase involved in cell wall biosynthesis